MKKGESLIRSDTRTWDIERVQAILPPEVDAAVLKLVLPIDQRNDMLFWKLERNGEDNVRSSCRLIQQTERANTVGESSCAVDEKPFWKKLWKLQVPNKIKVFAWRVCQNSLPSLLKFRQRSILTDALCPFYRTEVEDIYHALFECSEITWIWKKYVPKLVP